jgi:16S rRNA (guanine527-N7)-methyltransferase
LDLDVEVINERAERIGSQNCDVVSARALAPLNRLLELSSRHVKDGGICLFLKGTSVEAEVVEAQEKWRFAATFFPGETAGQGVLMQVTKIERV